MVTFIIICVIIGACIKLIPFLWDIFSCFIKILLIPFSASLGCLSFIFWLIGVFLLLGLCQLLVMICY